MADIHVDMSDSLLPNNKVHQAYKMADIHVNMSDNLLPINNVHQGYNKCVTLAR